MVSGDEMYSATEIFGMLEESNDGSLDLHNKRGDVLLVKVVVVVVVNLSVILMGIVVMDSVSFALV